MPAEPQPPLPPAHPQNRLLAAACVALLNQGLGAQAPCCLPQAAHPGPVPHAALRWRSRVRRQVAAAEPARWHQNAVPALAAVWRAVFCCWAGQLLLQAPQGPACLLIWRGCRQLELLLEQAQPALQQVQHLLVLVLGQPAAVQQAAAVPLQLVAWLLVVLPWALLLWVLLPWLLRLPPGPPLAPCGAQAAAERLASQSPL